MYQNDWILSKIAEGRRRDLMQQLEHDRLIREAKRAHHPQRHTLSHVLDWIGRQLVRWGERLQAQHATHHCHTLSHTTGG